MRTTLDIDEDVLAAAKELAASRKATAGKVLSELARQSLRSVESHPKIRNGVPILPTLRGSGSMTMEDVNRLRDKED